MSMKEKLVQFCTAHGITAIEVANDNMPTHIKNFAAIYNRGDKMFIHQPTITDEDITEFFEYMERRRFNAKTQG